MRIRDPQTGHSSRAGRSTRSRSGGTRAEVRAIPHLPSIQRQPPPPQTDYQTVSFAILVFFVQYRPKGHGGNPRKLTIGTLGEYTPEQARDAARQTIAANARGEDPQAEKRASRQRRSSNQFADVLD